MSKPKRRTFDASAAIDAQSKANLEAAQLNAQLGSGTRTGAFGDTLSFTPRRQTRSGVAIPEFASDAEREAFEKEHGSIDDAVTIYDPSFELGEQSQGLVDDATGISTLAGRNVQDFLSGGLDAVTDKQVELGEKFLTPQLERRRRALENRRASQGINLGSDAFSNVESDITGAENDAYIKNLLRSRGAAQQDFNTMLGAFGSGINARNAIASGAMGTLPGALAGQVAAPNVIGARQAEHQSKVAADERDAATPGWADVGLTIGKTAIGTAITGNPLTGAALASGIPIGTGSQKPWYLQ